MQSIITPIALLFATLPAFAGTVTNAEIGGFGTYVISGSASAYYTPGGTDPSTITATATADAITLGPERAGFLGITDEGANVFGHQDIFIGSFSVYCANELACNPQVATVPFTLGVPFEIEVDAFASILGVDYGSAGVTFQFSLYEVSTFNSSLPGAGVIVYDASSVPEPGTFALVGVFFLLAPLAGRVRNGQPDRGRFGNGVVMAAPSRAE